jgi:hypothetical protein
MSSPHVQFIIRTGMLMVTVTAGLLATSSSWVLLLILPVLPSVANRRAPSTDYLCTLIGMIIGGALFTPARENYRPTNNFRDYGDLLWIIGGAVAGALVGALIACADRSIVSKR